MQADESDESVEGSRRCGNAGLGHGAGCLGRDAVGSRTHEETMGCFLKDEADIGTFMAELEAGRLEMVDGTATPQAE